MHPGRSGEARHDGSEERREATEEHGDATSASQQLERSVDGAAPRLEELDREDALSEGAAHPVADRVAGDGAHDDEAGEGDDVHVPAAGDDAAEDHRGLAGEDEAEEDRRLGEDEQADHDEHEPGRQVQDPVEDVGDERLGQDDRDDGHRDHDEQGEQLTALEPEDGRRGLRHRLILAGCVRCSRPPMCDHWA